MDATGYITLSRQSGLLREFQVIANNIANSATTGYRQEGLVFSEYVQGDGAGDSVSMAVARTRATSMVQGALTRTGARLDLAIEGEGFFMVETPQGQRLTRAGNFASSAAGDLVTPDGFRVLDAGGAPLFIPPDALDLSISADGTLSAQGRDLGQIGLFMPTDGTQMTREDGVLFAPQGEVAPTFTARMLQGFLESANVDPVGQMARMIEVQRGYELGQKLLDTEHERLRGALTTLFR